METTNGARYKIPNLKDYKRQYLTGLPVFLKNFKDSNESDFVEKKERELKEYYQFLMVTGNSKPILLFLKTRKKQILKQKRLRFLQKENN